MGAVEDFEETDDPSLFDDNGIAPAVVTPLLKKAVKIIARHANVVARRRFAAARRGMPAAV